jgi:uncharacterized protein YgbK (DUF1537 family)
MSNEKIRMNEAFGKFGPIKQTDVDNELRSCLRQFDKKIIVLDDDPTGVQTVHDISVYTDWSVESIEAGFKESNSMFFILTNSRGLLPKETAKAHREIALNILKTAQKLKKEFIIISRSDSTLRGHYPLETKIIKETIESNSTIRFDGEVLLPFFMEGGRFTIDGVHYVQEGDYLIPVAETEFARDKSFGFTQSHLAKWIEEKSEGQFKAENVQHITDEDLRKIGNDSIVEKLMKLENFNKVIVDAVAYVDVKIFAIALIKSIRSGKNFMFRTAAAFPKVLGGITDQDLLQEVDIVKKENHHGGLVMVGSHVQKTSEQLDELRQHSLVEFVEFNQHLVLNPVELETEIDRVVALCEKDIRFGKTVVVYTKRERLDVGKENKEEELKIAVRISDAVTHIVQKLQVRPKYIIAKGGITSSDIGTKGLQVKKAVVAGQIKPGVPVWITGRESKFPEIPYIIFPGNVGTRNTLTEVVEILSGHKI